MDPKRPTTPKRNKKEHVDPTSARDQAQKRVWDSCRFTIHSLAKVASALGLQPYGGEPLVPTGERSKNKETNPMTMVRVSCGMSLRRLGSVCHCAYCTRRYQSQ